MRIHLSGAVVVALVLALIMSLGVLQGQAQAAGSWSLSALGSPYAQDFDTLAATGTSNTSVPAGWEFSESGTNANTTYRAGTGADNAGDTYSFGATGNSERAFGTLFSNSLAPLIGAQFTNDTGGAITSLDIAFTGEQWRLGQNMPGRAADRLDFQLSTDAVSLTTGTWTGYDALDFSSPVIGGTIGALDGNVAPNRTAISFTITGLKIPNGGTFWVRWVDLDLAPGADDGLAVDDFSLTPQGPAAPVAGDDTSLPLSPGPGTLNVTTNDGDADGDLVVSSVDLDPATAARQTTLAVSGEGGWSVDDLGNVTFTPDPGFTHDPTPIHYIVSDATALVSNQATIKMDYRPVASPDHSTLNPTGTAVTLDVLANDTTGDTAVPLTVQIDGTSTPGESLNVFGQGTWSVNGTTGAITFTPDAGYTGDPGKIEYYVQDSDGNVSSSSDGRGVVTIDYIQYPPVAVDDFSIDNPPGQVTLNITANDTDANNDLLPSTLDLDPLMDNRQKSVIASGEGTWTVDDSGNLTFAPQLGFTGDPTPISYTVIDATDLMSNKATITITYAARAAKVEALRELNSLLSRLTNPKQRTLVSMAISNISRSLSPSYWLDGSHLRERNGSMVFVYERTAVSLLGMAVKSYGLNPASINEPVIRALLAADRMLASEAIEAARNAGGASRLIKLAQSCLARGDGHAASNRPENALDAYWIAWGCAVGAY